MGAALRIEQCSFSKCEPPLILRTGKLKVKREKP
jgi:hypothetical protein